MKRDPGNSLKRARRFRLGDRPFKIRNQITDADSDDLFRFKIRSSHQLDIKLSKLRGNLNLELYTPRRKPRKTLANIGNVLFSELTRRQIRRNLTRVSQSKKRGNKKERIDTLLEPGTYYLRVFQRKVGEETAYRLKVKSNAVPTSAVNPSASLSGQKSVLVTQDLLQFTDKEDNDASLLYTLTNLPENGRLELNGRSLSIGDQFTQGDINQGRLNYISIGIIEQITNNSVNDIASGISGSNVVFNRVNQAGDVQENDDLNDTSREVFLYDVAQGKLKQITNNNAPDFPTGISGNNVVGNTVETFFGQPSPEPFFYDGTQDQLIPLSTNSLLSQLGVNTGFPPVIQGDTVAWSAFADFDIDLEIFTYDIQTQTTTQITSDTVNQVPIGVSDTYILWNEINLEGQSEEVFLYDRNTGQLRQLSSGSGLNAAIGLSDEIAAWTGFDGNDLEIFFYDLQTGITTQVTNNSVDDVGVEISGLSGRNLVWNGLDGDDFDVFFYDGLSGTTRQLTNNETGDVAIGISGSNVIWSSFDQNGKADEVFFYNGSENATTQVTNSDTSNFAVGISGTNIVWNAFDGNDTEVFFADVGNPPSSDRFSFTVSDSTGTTTTGTFTITT